MIAARLLVLLALLAAPLAAEAQQAGKVYRVGFLSSAGPPSSSLSVKPYASSDTWRARIW